MNKQLHSVNPMNDDIEQNRIQRDSTARNERLSTLFKVAGLLLAGFFIGFALKTITTSEDGNTVTVISSPPGNNPQPVPIPPANPPDNSGELDIPRLEDLPRTTFVHLFSWKWTDIEKECVNVLGPKGFSAVQVSPVNEHIEPTLIRNIIGKPDNPWWARYQPVSYKIESRSGTREEFISMINTCKSVGVDIYVDAVLNHMAAMNVGVGNAGTPFDSDNLIYPDPTVNFDASHFNECDPPEIQGEDYGTNAERVRRCRLVGLPDLLQEDPFVRDQMVAFLQDLSDMGVAGLRLDVAKHMFPLDLDAILSRVTGLDYVFGEVPSYGGEVVLFEDYTPYFDVTEFRYKADLQNIFMGENRRLAELQNIGQSFGYVSTTEAVVFVDNHDTQRASDARLIFRAGQVYNLANIFLLSWPYGYPKIMSSYYFDEGNFDVGPPEYTNEGGETVDVYTETGDLCSDPTKTSFDSSDTWICEHRRREMLNMVHFKNYAHYKNAYDITNWWTNGFQAIGYSRSGPDGVMGYVIINKEDFAIERSYYTGLPDGVYCDVINGDFERNAGCSGRTVVVQNGGYISVNMEAMSGLAIFEGARLS